MRMSNLEYDAYNYIAKILSAAERIPNIVNSKVDMKVLTTEVHEICLWECLSAHRYNRDIYINLFVNSFYLDKLHVVF